MDGVQRSRLKNRTATRSGKPALRSGLVWYPWIVDEIEFCLISVAYHANLGGLPANRLLLHRLRRLILHLEAGIRRKVSENSKVFTITSHMLLCMSDRIIRL